MFDGGCGICQSPFVINMLRNLGKSDCGQAATLGCHDFWTQQVCIGEIVQSDISLNHKMCKCYVVCVNQAQAKSKVLRLKIGKLVLQKPTLVTAHSSLERVCKFSRAPLIIVLLSAHIQNLDL